MERSHSCQAKFSRLLGLLEASPWSARLQRQLDWLSRARSISTTHAIGGNVASAGATRGVHSVRWQWGNRIVWNWVLTFPGAAIIGIFYFLTNFTIGHFIPAPIAQV